MAYIGTSPSNGVRRVHTYTATASQTTFSGASSEGVTLSYADTNYLDVYQNGILLGSADYTATSGTSVVLTQAASADDLVVIVVYDVFSVADTVSKANGGTFDSAVSFAGDITDSGDLTLDVAGDIILDADGGDVTIKDGGSSIGAITNISSDLSIYSLTGNHKGLRFGNGQIVPTNNAGADSDNTTDLGGTSNRFKNLYLSGGAYIGGTGSANYLDDYEEGTWTPVISLFTSAPTVSYSNREGSYTKIGNVVYTFFDCTATVSGGSGGFILQGLPFASSSASTMAGYSVVQHRASSLVAAGSSGDVLTGYASSSTIYFEYGYSGSSGFGTRSGTVGLNSSGRVTGYIVYKTDS